MQVRSATPIPADDPVIPTPVVSAPGWGGVDQRLDGVPVLADPGRSVEPLPGGLTNDNYLVTVAGRRLVARLFRPSSAVLQIDRAAEHQNATAAASTGIAPQVIAFVPSAGVLVTQWIPGVTLTAPELRQESMIRRVADACRQLHSGPRFAADFDMFGVQRAYLQIAQSAGFRLPDRYADFMPVVAQIRTVLQMDPPSAVPCHNDLLAANIIDDGDRLWLIDFEYSGNNDPCFELGNIWSESNLADDHLELLVSSYFGVPDPALIARARLQALMSQYGWTLWGVIQQGSSDLDFDFWSWSMEKYERAVSTFTSPQVTALLHAAGERSSRSGAELTRHPVSGRSRSHRAPTAQEITP